MKTNERWVKRQLSLLRPEKECFAKEKRDDPTAQV